MTSNQLKLAMAGLGVGGGVAMGALGVAFGTVPASTGSVVGERPEPVLGNTATTTTTPPTAPKISFASPSVTAEVPPGFGVQEGSPGD